MRFRVKEAILSKCIVPTVKQGDDFIMAWAYVSATELWKNVSMPIKDELIVMLSNILEGSNVKLAPGTPR